MNNIENDKELVRQARSGEFDAFNQLVNKYERRLYSLALRIVKHQEDAEEAVQNTLLKVIEHLDNFREESSFYTWLMRIATNASLKILQKRKRLTTVPYDEEWFSENLNGIPLPEFIAPWNNDPRHILEQKETRELLETALSELDEKHRVVFLLRDVEGLSVKETAKTLNLSESNVKVRLMRARLQLRERLTRVFAKDAVGISREKP